MPTDNPQLEKKESASNDEAYRSTRRRGGAVVSHYSVVVCLSDPDKLKDVLAPFDENLDVEPYRDYEKGDPKDFWAVTVLREESGLNLDDATLTWAQVAEAYNARYSDDDQMLVDDSGRAYTISTYNPESKWDYWRVGGRWGGYFRVRPGCEAQVIKPERGWDSPDLVLANACDGGPKAALDLAALREAKADEARKTYAEFHALVAGTPEARPWSEFVDLLDKVEGYTIDQARSEYHSQPRVEALKGSDFRWHDDAIATFQKPERLYVEHERARAVPGYALVTIDGKWMAPGQMGWFGMGSDDESSRIGYWEAANAYIESLPESAWLIAVDCHI